MNLLIAILFGYLYAVGAVYRIPEYDTCTLVVLLCDDFIKPLTQIDNSTLEMFETIGQVNEVCDELSKFRECLEKAERFCKENSDLYVGFELLDNRRLAFDLCVHDSPLQQVYMTVEGCVNKYSHPAIEFCTDKAIELVGIGFMFGFEEECLYLSTMQHCHVAIVKDLCGSIAGNFLEKLVVFRGQRDFMCIRYEKEKRKNLDEYRASMDSYVQQFKNSTYYIKPEDESEEFVKVHDRASSPFQSRISPILDEDFAFDASNSEHTFKLGMSYCTEKRSSRSCLPEQEILDATYTSENSAQPTRFFYEQRTDKILSEKNYACKTKALFLLIGIRPSGEFYLLGNGDADVFWATISPLKDISCSWMVDPAAIMPLAKCYILIDNSINSRKEFKKKMKCDMPFNATIAVYETSDKMEAKRVVELRVRSFVKHSSSLEKSLDKVKNFKKHARDIRYWCSEHHKANLYEKQNGFNSIHRMGLMPSDAHEKLNEQNKIFDEKYNFYTAELSEYPADTNIRLMTSGEGSLENEFEDGDSNASQNYDETMSTFFKEEMFLEKNLRVPSTKLPSAQAKPPSHSYRPYELYRPRIGETLEAEDPDTSTEDLDTKEAIESCSNSKGMSSEAASETSYASHIYAEEMCPAIPENISILDNKLGRYSKLSYINTADPLDAGEPDRYKKFSISEKGGDIPLDTILKTKEQENIYMDNKQNLYEEIYVVTPSTEIETSSVSDRAVYEDADAQNLDENVQILNAEDNSQEFVEYTEIETSSVFDRTAFEDADAQNLDKNVKILNAEDNSQDFVKFLKASRSKVLKLKADLTEVRSSIIDFLEFISNYRNDKYPFSYKFDPSANYEAAAEEKFSPKIKFLRLDQKYANEMKRDILNVFKALVKSKVGLMRKRKTLKKEM